MPNRSIILTFALLAIFVSGVVYAQEPSITLTVESIEETVAGYVVVGNATGDGPPTEGHARHSYNITIYADIMEGDDSKYPELADGMRIRSPQGAQTSLTPGSGPGGTMTYDERDGINITIIRLAAGGGLGPLEFTATIPTEHAGKTFRIRAELYHQANYTGAAWPAITYHHDKGHSGTLAAFGASSSGGDEGDDGKPGDSGKEDEDPWSLADENDLEPPPDPYGEIADVVGSGGNTPTDPLVGDPEDQEFFDWVPDDVGELEAAIEAIDAQIAGGRLTEEQIADLMASRKELAPFYYQALIDEATHYDNMLMAKWFLKDLVGTAADLGLTYCPATSAYWTSGKIIYELSQDDWQNAYANWHTLPGDITIKPGAVIKKFGTKMQIAQHYALIAGVLNDHYGPKQPWGHTDTVGGTYGDWGTSDGPGTPEPTWGGELR